VARRKSRAANTELRIVFDTNIIYTKSVTALVRQDVVQFLADNAKHDDLTLSWYIPDTVSLERRYQMLARAMDLLPAIQEMEALLSHNLNITEDIIAARVDAHITKQLNSLGLKPLVLNTSEVDWSRVLHDAASRAAPFERGEKEKGFRDLFIGEAFIQLAKSSPATAKLCRVILVTQDKRLSEMVVTRVGDQDNVKLFATLEELRGFINTMASDVSEAFVNKYKAAASELFIKAVDQANTPFSSQKLREAIQQRSAEELAVPPPGATTVEQETRWTVAQPEFVRQTRQRVHWSSRVTIPLTASRYETDPVVNVATSSITIPSPGFSSSSSRMITSDPMTIPFASLPDLSTYYTPVRTYYGTTASLGGKVGSVGQLLAMRRIEVQKGQAFVDVQWSVTVRTNDTLSNPTVDDFSFVEATWT
jgi:hypothetical protein